MTLLPLIKGCSRSGLITGVQKCLPRRTVPPERTPKRYKPHVPPRDGTNLFQPRDYTAVVEEVIAR